MRRPAEALEHYRRAVSSPEVMPCAFFSLDEVLTDQGKEDEALEIIDSLISRTGGGADSLLARGWHLVSLGRLEEALDVVRSLEKEKLGEEEARELEELRERVRSGAGG